MILQFLRSPAPVQGDINIVSCSTTPASVNIGANVSMQGKGERIWRFEVDPGGGDVGILFGSAALIPDLSAAASFTAAGTPSSTDTVAETVTFGSALGWSTGAKVVPTTTGGGLTAGTTYFWNAASSTSGSFHTTLANALAGTSKVNLTASITSVLTAEDARCVRIPAGSFKEFTLRSSQANEQYFGHVGSASATLRYYPVSHPSSMVASNP